MKPSQVNKKLIWDFDWDESEYDTEEFERWYVRRVLTEGMSEDIYRIGFDNVCKYLPDLRLPKAIRHFWERFFREIWPRSA
ncbi:hypothetical protein DRQ36_06410 [bacterium]|nr:MAG: hypothetical protein DRQ36_06410 [bacterium]